jgi:type I restriction enzyme, S subunit
LPAGLAASSTYPGYASGPLALVASVCIETRHIAWLRFVQGKESYITPAKYETLRRHTVGQGDIIVGSFIDEEMRVCALPKLSTPAIAKADCFCVRPRPDLVETTYLTYQLASSESYNALAEEIHGATRPRINTTQLRRLDVRVCPLPEQQEIVRRVEALFKKADEIETRYHKAKAFVDKLTQSILAKAFRGELVPQDPNDEPASKLLERIRSERVDKTSPKRKKKRG